MAVIQMPSRGKKDETGMITKWHKKTGDWVAEGDELFSFFALPLKFADSDGAPVRALALLPEESWPFVKSKCTKKQKYFYEARMRAISSRKSCSEHR